jgi:ADP-ribosylglycohydrolase
MLLGLAIGDALGNTSEGLTARDRDARYGEIRDYLPNRHADGRRVGLPSDDSQLAFWTLESLLECGDLDPEDVAQKYTGREIFGIGSTVRRFLANRADGVTPWYRCGVESAGNGALMRTAPIVLLHPEGTSAALWLNAALASIVTHRDACSVASCVAFADLLAIGGCRTRPPRVDPRDVPRHGAQVCTDQPYRPRGGHFTDWEGPFPDYLEHVLGEARQRGWGTRAACDAWYSGAYLLETVPSVLWILANHADNPEEAIVRAINDTKDNDTVAAIVGAAIGALHGECALPTRWRSGLLGRTQATDDGQVFRLVAAAANREWD